MRSKAAKKSKEVAVGRYFVVESYLLDGQLSEYALISKLKRETATSLVLERTTISKKTMSWGSLGPKYVEVERVNGDSAEWAYKKQEARLKIQKLTQQVKARLLKNEIDKLHLIQLEKLEDIVEQLSQDLAEANKALATTKASIREKLISLGIAV